MRIKYDRISILMLLFLCPCLLAAQSKSVFQITYQGKAYPLYPGAMDVRPDIPSPYTTSSGIEVVTAFTEDEQYVLIPVTVENGDPWEPARGLWGKGNQLAVNARDFPTLARTGLHSDEELDTLTTITGRPLDEIDRQGRPGGLSSAGFMAYEEDLRSVLRGDNELVGRMGLTHNELARPLFHVWNMLMEVNHEGIVFVLYNNQTVFVNAHRTKPAQLSLFNDGFLGGSDIYISRTLSASERAFLRRQYPDQVLTAEQMEDLLYLLSHIHTGELEAYYVMRHGFYEGHTEYRVDPIAIALIFGLRSIEEIESAFPEELFYALTDYFISPE